MPNDNRRLTIEVSFLVDKDIDTKLEEMVDAFPGSKSALLRLLVLSAYKMRVTGQPVCANAEACRAPQLFMSFGIPAAASPERRPDPDTNRQLVGHDDA